MKKSILLAAIIGLFLTLACVTVNVYFPAAEVQQAADKIVEEVHGTEPSSTAPESTSEQSAIRRMFRRIAPFGSVAYAEADINVSTPNIRALKASLGRVGGAHLASAVPDRGLVCPHDPTWAVSGDLDGGEQRVCPGRFVALAPGFYVSSGG